MRYSALKILLGLVLAIAGAGIALHGVAVVRGEVPADGYSLQSALRTILMVATVAIPLALVLIWLAEARRVRGLLFWICSGGLIAGIAHCGLAYASAVSPHALTSVLASGVIGGLIYWAIVGKHAGMFAAEIDRENQADALSEMAVRRRCRACAAAMLLVGLVPLALFGWQLAERSAGTWPDVLRQHAEAQGKLLLKNADMPWADMKIEHHVGRIMGTAPTIEAKSAGFAKAQMALSELAGLPGVVAYLQNDIAVAHSVIEPLPLFVAAETAAPAVVVAKSESRIRRMRLGRSMRAGMQRRWTKQQAELKLAEQRAAARRRAVQDVENAKRVAAEAAAKAKAQDDERRAEAAREKAAVDAARKAEAEKADENEAVNGESARDVPQTPAALPSNCDADFADLFKSTIVQFDRDASVLDAKLAALFDRAALLSKSCSDYTIDVVGHADRTGRKSVNLARSLSRAAAVRDALAARGVPLSRLSVKGFGDTRPLDPSRHSAAFARNRRVELSASRTVTLPPPAADALAYSRATKPLTADVCHVRLNRIVAKTGIRFAVNATRVRPAAARAIKELARLMRRCPNHELAINGHADRRGSIEDNRMLSERRAVAVRDLLIHRGVEGGRLAVTGHGAMMPRAKADARSAYAQNRRVEIDVLAIVPPPE